MKVRYIKEKEQLKLILEFKDDIKLARRLKATIVTKDSAFLPFNVKMMTENDLVYISKVFLNNGVLVERYTARIIEDRLKEYMAPKLIKKNLKDYVKKALEENINTAEVKWRSHKDSHMLTEEEFLALKEYWEYQVKKIARDKLIKDNLIGYVEKALVENIKTAETKWRTHKDSQMLMEEEFTALKKKWEHKLEKIARIKYKEKKKKLTTYVKKAIEENIKTAETKWRAHRDSKMLTEKEFQNLKRVYIIDWALNQSGLNKRLDSQQADAVCVLDRDTKITARAGSGKTLTIVARVLYLIQICGVKPNEILLLSFNRKAANEIRERLESVIINSMPHVMTFHSLAYSLVHPSEELIFDNTVNEGLSREIQTVIDQHIQSDEYRAIIRRIMLDRYQQDWVTIEKGGFHLPIKELIKFRNSLPRETLKGEYVKSYGEKIIANTLFSYNINYKYERNFRWNEINYKPDFTIIDNNNIKVVIEYFGLDNKDPDYDEMSEEKRRFWANRKDCKFLEFTPKDIAVRGVEDFKKHLIDKLYSLGVENRLLSEEEIWHKIEKRAIDSFTRVMRSFVSRCRKQNMDIGGLKNAVSKHITISEAEELFLKVGTSVYSDYLDLLEKNNQEDFDGLMWRAVDILKNGFGTFTRDRGREIGDIKNIKYVLIDEFQDFSEMFYTLTMEIRRLSPNVIFFCVGDDWQAINGFAGSNLKYFKSFDNYYLDTNHLMIETNYRSTINIVKTGNYVMRGLGNEAKCYKHDKGMVFLLYRSKYKPSAAEVTRFEGDEFTPMVLRLAKYALDLDQDVVMISRRNNVRGYINYDTKLEKRLSGLPLFEEHIRSHFPEKYRKRITASTSHNYKGAENKAVIVLDADQGSYPLLHPDWELLRLFGDELEDIKSEEQRLFYVAVTRAMETLLILCEHRMTASPYIVGLEDELDMMDHDWNHFDCLPSQEDVLIEVRVYNAYEVREQLKKEGYRFSGNQGKYWYRVFPTEKFELNDLKNREWVKNNLKIEIYSETGEKIY